MPTSSPAEASLRPLCTALLFVLFQHCIADGYGLVPQASGGSAGDQGPRGSFQLMRLFLTFGLCDDVEFKPLFVVYVGPCGLIFMRSVAGVCFLCFRALRLPLRCELGAVPAAKCSPRCLFARVACFCV